MTDMPGMHKAAPRAPSELMPELVETLREPYGFGAFRADLLAGLTVAVVALPLSMAIAIASGVSPDRGLVAAIVGGFLVSALGGSRFQIGGPGGGVHRAGRGDGDAARRRRAGACHVPVGADAGGAGAPAGSGSS